MDCSFTQTLHGSDHKDMKLVFIPMSWEAQADLIDG